MPRDFLMLAKTATFPFSFPGFYVSEKLDGQRALWTGRPYDPSIRFSGLLSRYGQPIFAPPWWTDPLPIGIPLDGELWIDRRTFQTLRTIVAGLRPKVEADPGWKDVKFMVFDSPPYHRICQSGSIRGPSRTEFHLPPYDGPNKRGEFDLPVSAIEELLVPLLQREGVATAVWHHQEQLPFNRLAAASRLTALLSQVESLEGEGLMLRSPILTWGAQRTNLLLKVKPRRIGIGRVVGYIPGKGKYLGMMGSLSVEWRPALGLPVHFDISGFTDEERQNKQILFPVGSEVAFSYRELSDDGIPKEAQYYRGKE